MPVVPGVHADVENASVIVTLEVDEEYDIEANSTSDPVSVLI